MKCDKQRPKVVSRFYMCMWYVHGSKFYLHNWVLYTSILWLLSCNNVRYHLLLLQA